MPKKKKTRVVPRKKVYVKQPVRLVDRPSTHSLTNPRAVERYLDAMTLHHALILAYKLFRDARSAAQESRESPLSLIPHQRNGRLASVRLAQPHGSIAEIPAETPMKRRIFGLENEYGLTCTLNGQRHLSPDHVARYLFEQVIPGVRNANSNVFLENGARLYLDTGFHPEYATPECDDVAELVSHDKAGERIVEDLRHQAEKRLREDGLSGDILLFKNNTDSAGNTYGCHENYLVSREVSFQRLAEALIPFFVTRQIFAGAGKVLQTPRGFHYCLSQRAQHICQEISGSTTSSRSIINTRDEPHADAERYRRLHIIVGDSNMSEVATYLKVGTTAVVLDMIEAGYFDKDYSLQSPVQAIRDISHDPTLREIVKLKDGRTITPLQMQMDYLEYAIRHADSVGAD